MTKKSRLNFAHAIFAICALFLIEYTIVAAKRVAVIPYSRYQQLLRDGKVDSVGISDRTVQGTLKEPLPRDRSSS